MAFGGSLGTGWGDGSVLETGASLPVGTEVTGVGLGLAPRVSLQVGEFSRPMHPTLSEGLGVGVVAVGADVGRLLGTAVVGGRLGDAVGRAEVGAPVGAPVGDVPELVGERVGVAVGMAVSDTGMADWTVFLQNGSAAPHEQPPVSGLYVPPAHPLTLWQMNPPGFASCVLSATATPGMQAHEEGVTG